MSDSSPDDLGECRISHACGLTLDERRRDMIDLERVRLADEPTFGLVSNACVEVMVLLKEFNTQGRTLDDIPGDNG